jgi:glutathione S-transferase
LPSRLLAFSPSGLTDTFPDMRATLYGIAVSHPSHAARAMLDLKGIDYELKDFQAGTQPIGLRLAGFRGRKVPALEIDGRKVQGSTSISRLLDEIRPDPPLFPPDRRDAVEQAEAWGEREFQPLPRRFFRWGMARRPQLRRWVLENLVRMPAPSVVGTVLIPQWRYFAYVSRANDEYTRVGVARLPELLDRVDELIADRTIGREGEPNAADFQVASTIAVLRAFGDLRAELDGRPGTDLAAKLFPREVPLLPPFLPEDWLRPIRH